MFRFQFVLRLAFAIAIIGLILFGAAGRVDLPFFWAYLALFGLLAIVTPFTISPELLEERRKPAETGRDNLPVLRAIAALTFLSQWIVAGLDVGRFHWTDNVPAALRIVGLIAFASVLAIWNWAMRSNPFFSAAVRLQHDRGHHVVNAGPYRFVRHPGYASLVLLGWGGPMALGSWAAVATHALVIVLFVRRVLLEDRMLREELDGYDAYAARVRYRFLPGVF